MTSFSLKTKVYGILILAVLAVTIVTEVAFISHLAGEMKDDKEEFIANLAQNASILASTITPHFVDNDFVFMNSLAARYLKYPSCTYVSIIDRNQKLMAQSGHQNLGDRFDIPAPFESYRVGAALVSKYRKTGKEYFDISCPIKAGDFVLGSVRLGFNSDFENEAAASLRRSILVSGVALVSVIILGIFLASWVVDKTVIPLLHLKSSAEKVGTGDYDQVLEIKGDDEVGMLTESFNNMVRELKTSRARLVEKQFVDSIISNMREALFVLAPDGSIQTINKTTLELTGYDESELINRPFGTIFGKSGDGGAILSELKDVGLITHIEKVIHSKSGETIPVLVSGSVMAQGADILGMVFVATDITEQQKARKELQNHREHLQQLVDERTIDLMLANQKLKEQISERERMEEELVKAQKLEAVGILAGGIAHDFNNLLTTILANISMSMLEVDKGHAANENLRRAEQASLRAVGLTQQLLTFSRGGAPVKRITSLGDIIRESAEFALQGSQVRCDLSIPKDLWFTEVDAGQISQVMHNLVINADQAMPEGGTIAVCCENAVIAAGTKVPVSAGKYVKVTVRDNGVGIANEHLLKIFDPYYTTKQRGSGLGLATTYSIIRKHSGSITVDSQLGVGTAFTIYLPATDATGALKQAENSALQMGQGKILVMDDEEDLLQTCIEALARLGYTTVSAKDGAQAVELYQAAMRSGAPFDAVIMDITIRGGMGGQEAVRRLHEIYPGVKAVVSSGYSNDPIMSDLRNHGFVAALAKPYRIKDLGKTVRLVLGEDKPGAAKV